MPVPFAPPIAPFPSAPAFTGGSMAGAVNSSVPFIRPGIPITAPPPPAIVPLTVAPAAPAAGGLLPGLGTGAAVLGAGVLGLGIGNAIYEDLLKRPFGPSLGDIFFPQAQPEPLPLLDPIPSPLPGGQCETLYRVRGTGRYYNTFRERFETNTFNSVYLRGPLSNPHIVEAGDNVVRWMISGFDRNTGLAKTSQLASVTSSLAQVSQGSFLTILPTREDNQADDCGQLEPTPQREPKALPRPELPRPDELRRIPTRIPRVKPNPRLVPNPGPKTTPDAPGLPQPGTPPQPEPIIRSSSKPAPGQLPIPFDKPKPFPDPLPEPEKEPTEPIVKTPVLECCPSLERKLDELVERECPEECDLSEVEEKLEEILDRLSTDVEGSVDLTPCNAEEETTEEYGGEGLDGIHLALLAMGKAIALIHENTRCEPEPCVSAVPDWWQARKGARTPQLAIILRKSGSNNYHTLNVPHPITEPRPTSCPVTPYNGGNWQATLYLIDNSKLIINAKLKSDAINALTQAATLIKPEMLGETLQIATTERRGFQINQSLMVPRRMDYFAEGQGSHRPDWRVTLDD